MPAATVVVALLVAPSCSVLSEGTTAARPRRRRPTRYLTAWAAGDVAAMAALVADPPDDFATRVQGFRAGLQVVTAEVGESRSRPRGTTGDGAVRRPSSGLQGVGTWAYDGAVDLSRSTASGGWPSPRRRCTPTLAEGTGSSAPGSRARGRRSWPPGASRWPSADPARRPASTSWRGRWSGQLPGAEPPRRPTQRGLAVRRRRPRRRRRGRRRASRTSWPVTPRGASRWSTSTGRAGRGGPAVRRRAPRAAAPDPGLRHPARRPRRRWPTSLPPVALVAIDSRTGAIRAVANNPSGFDRALLGEYAPGLDVQDRHRRRRPGRRRRSPSEIVACPYETRLGDSAPFTNAFGEDYGDIPSSRPSPSPATPPSSTRASSSARPGLLETRGALRVQPGLRPRGARSSPPSFPLPETDTEIGAAAIGQGRVSVTPLHMATVAAAGRRRHLARRPTWPASRPTEGSHSCPRLAPQHLPDFLGRSCARGRARSAAILGARHRRQDRHRRVRRGGPARDPRLVRRLHRRTGLRRGGRGRRRRRRGGRPADPRVPRRTCHRPPSAPARSKASVSPPTDTAPDGG